MTQRLRVLREWKWSSYPAYAGHVAAPQWLSREVLGRLCDGRNSKEQQAALRQYTEKALGQGLAERP